MTKIKKFTLEHNITVSGIARATGTTRTCISNKVNGRSNKWLFEEVFYMSRESGVPIEEFFELLDIKFEGGINNYEK